MGLNIRRFLLGIALIFGASLFGKTIMCEGEDAVIPPITQEIHALHLRHVGAARIYALHLPDSLTDLNLSDNQLILLPQDLIPKQIQRLWLADNRLLSLPENVSAWHHLTYLNLDRNLFSVLPDLSSTRLRWLRLNHNQLTALPPLPNSVERLYLAHNKLTAFPENKPTALRHLTLADNPLTAVPDTLGCGLEALDLSGTHLQTLPKDLNGWRTLRVLNLARCPLSNAEKDRISAFFDPLSTLLIF